jgi:hypothetical protein
VGGGGRQERCVRVRVCEGGGVKGGGDAEVRDYVPRLGLGLGLV